VNSEHLTHIAQNTQRISGQDALELEELCRKFPAFPTPFILLAKYYHQTGDYRAEEAIQKAAIRVHDRSWLADLIVDRTTQTTAETELTQENQIELASPVTENIENEREEKNTEEAVVTAIQEVETPHSVVVPEVSINHETAIETVNEITDDTDYPSLNEVSTLFIPEDPNDCVFEEIESFETGNEASMLGYAATEKWEEESVTLISTHEAMGAGGLILPDTEELEMPDDRAESKNNSESETLFIAATPYQIEKFYPDTAPSKTDEKPVDFYSWLNNPSSQTEEEVPEEVQPEITDHPKSQQRSIIDKFIETNPGVIRPRKDFFTPETAAKKSEHLPENLATETLAKVYLQQGNTDGAIRIYERLMLKFPEKNTYFADLIEKIKQENNP
jgi:tetratricopeptide (TPR) repeat protein